MQRTTAWLSGQLAQRRVVVLAGLTGIVFPLLAFSIAATFPWVSLGLAVLGGGMALLLLLIPEMSALLWVAAGTSAGVGLLLAHSLLRAGVPALGSLSFLGSLSGFVLLLGLIATTVLARRKWTRKLRGWSRGDVIFLIAVVPVLASTLLVASRNGYRAVPDGGEEFLARGFVNGDTMTLLALVNASGSRQEAVGSGLLRKNPFAGNGTLEYPTLVHRALADVQSAVGAGINRIAWWLILPVLLGTVAVSVLSAHYVFRGQTLPWWSVVVVLAAFGTTWESFTYPQSHTFLTGLFLLLVLLLVLRDQRAVLWERAALAVGAWTLALLLLFSNAVFGTAAVALVVATNVLRLFEPFRTRGDRLHGLLAALVLAALFVRFPPGQGALGTLNVAYTAVPQFITAALPALIVLWAIWDTRWLHRSTALLAAAVVLPALAFVTLFLSARDIVAENSPRFLFLLVLVGWPAVIAVVQRVADWWWREVRHVEHTVAEHVLLWGGGVLTVLSILLPVLASVAGTLDVLVRKRPLVVSADELAAFTWIRQNTPADAVFLRAPESLFENTEVPPLSLPAFTGRAQLRSEYWLSPEDEVLRATRAFFREPTNESPPADYLFCGPERDTCPGSGAIVFSTGAVSVHVVPPSRNVR